MALINCPECGQSVSDTARKCPNCGYTLKKINLAKLLVTVGMIVLLLIVVVAAYYFLVFTPQQIPIKANALLEEGNYIEADVLFAQLGDSEENQQLREQLFFESRIVNAAKVVQENLIFPDSMTISEVVIWEEEILDTSASTETQEVYISVEPEILIHYLAQSKGGSMVDGYIRVNWEDGSYVAGRSVDDLTIENSIPWYIDSNDTAAQLEFWSEQICKSKIVSDLSSRVSVGTYDLNRCNRILATTLGKTVSIIPAGDLIVTPTPRVVSVTPKPAHD